MGIRFRCPSGHKLNVKEFLAGKRGICPKCGVKFQIPAESDPDLVKNVQPGEELSAGSGGSSGTEQLDLLSAQQPVVQAESDEPAFPNLSTADLSADKNETNAHRPTSDPTDHSPVIDLGAKSPQNVVPADLDLQIRTDSGGNDLAQMPQSTKVPQVTTKPVEPIHLPSGATVDPISEAPHAVWYVRPPSGGQFGPASGDIMRSWISEGRVTIDSLVWREGWPDWQSAGSTFPGLLTPGSHAPSAEIPQIVTQMNANGSTEVHQKRKSTKMTLPLVGSLVVACLILLAALIYVVQVMN